MIYSRLALLVFLPTVVVVEGFLNDAFAPVENLKKITDAQTGTFLNVQLEVGKDKDAKMSISGLKLELLQQDVEEKTKEHLFMPGCDGPHPDMSSGPKQLEVHETGHFINHAGKQLVKLGQSCWEMVWKHDSPAGSLVCGFELPEALKRNQAMIDAGKFYVAFTVWTAGALEEFRAKKAEVERLCAKAAAKKDEELAKYAAENNPLKKMWHYRNAFAAAEEYYLYPRQQMERVPGPNDCVSIGDDLYMSTKGEVWTQSGTGWFANKKRALGTATARLPFADPALEGLAP